MSAAQGIDVTKPVVDSATIRATQGNDLVGCMNVTNRKDPRRGTNYSLEHNNATYYIEEGKSVPIPRPLWERIKSTRDVWGQNAFEECPLEKCDQNAVFKMRNYVDTGVDRTVDNDFIETLDAIIASGAGDQVPTMLSTCQSKPTLQSLIKKFSSDQTIDQAMKTSFVSCCINRMKALSSD